jgi:hypothetical protein
MMPVSVVTRNHRAAGRPRAGALSRRTATPESDRERSARRPASPAARKDVERIAIGFPGPIAEHDGPAGRLRATRRCLRTHARHRAVPWPIVRPAGHPPRRPTRAEPSRSDPRQHCGERAKKNQPRTVGLLSNGGDEEDRTPDLRIANATLSQLSYVPTIEPGIIPEVSARASRGPPAVALTTAGASLRHYGRDSQGRACAAGFAPCSRHSTTSPATIMGRLSHCPMLSPVEATRCFRNSSGSRVNSTRKRNTP